MCGFTERIFRLRREPRLRSDQLVRFESLTETRAIVSGALQRRNAQATDTWLQVIEMIRCCIRPLSGTLVASRRFVVGPLTIGRAPATLPAMSKREQKPDVSPLVKTAAPKEGTFTRNELASDPDKVLEVANNLGRAVVLGDDGKPDVIVSVLMHGF